MTAAAISAGCVRWAEVVSGLMIREVRIRYARGRVGYAWTFVLPAAWIGGLILFFAFLGHRPALDVPVSWFVVTGILPYVTFRQTIAGMTRNLAANTALTGFAGIGQQDILFAAGMLELLNSALLALIILTAASLMTGQVPADPPVMAAGLFTAWALGASFGRLAARASAVSDLASRLTPVALRPMFWISGIFFSAAEIPEAYRDLLWFNPLLHATELTRLGAFGIGDQGFFSGEVPALAAALLLVLSFAIPAGPAEVRA
jgi:ABC-type polysaccharide/polyol phosphate export permease